MRHGRPLGKRWTKWPRDVGVGFSYREPGLGSLRGDMAPARNPGSELQEWRCALWRGTDRSDVVAVVWGETHWDCAREVELAAAELRMAA